MTFMNKHINSILIQEDVEGFLAAGAPEDEYLSEASMIEEALLLMNKSEVTETNVFTVISLIWRQSFDLSEDDLNIRIPSLQQVTKKVIETYDFEKITKNRKQLLTELLNFSKPIENIVPLLKRFPWDSAEPIVMLKFEHVQAVLQRYLAYELTENQVEDWANAIEGREDIGFETTHEGTIGEIIHTLANPLLTNPLTHNRAKQIIGGLVE